MASTFVIPSAAEESGRGKGAILQYTDVDRNPALYTFAIDERVDLTRQDRTFFVKLGYAWVP